GGTRAGPGGGAAKGGLGAGCRVGGGNCWAPPAPPGTPSNTALPRPKRSNTASRKPRERRRPIGKGRKRRAADARHVKDDGCRIGERMKKWFGELPIRANTIEQKQGRPPFRPACGRDAERLSADRHRPNVDAIFSRAVVHGRRLHGTDAMGMPCTLLIEDIRPGSRRIRTMTRVTQRGGCRLFLVRTLVEPVAPVEPPAALVLLAAGHKCFRARRRERSGNEGGFLVAGRI